MSLALELEGVEKVMQCAFGGVRFIHFGALVMEVDLAKVGEPKPQSAQLMVFS